MTIIQETSLDVYHGIIDTAKSIATFTSTASFTRSPCSPAPCIPALRLHPVPDLISVLCRDGVQPEASKRIAASFVKFSGKLKELFVMQYQQACMKLSETSRCNDALPLSKLFHQLSLTFASMYDRRIEGWVTEVRKRIQGKTSSDGAPHPPQPKDNTIERKGKGSYFNAGYTQVLEKYFEKQRFPSRVDKESLAKKSGMTYKQIHVWFQNRRNRTKTTGPLRSNQAQANRPKAHKALRGTRRTTSIALIGNCSNLASGETVKENQPLQCNGSPLYAFPAIYPPDVNDKDPFPCRSGDFSFFGKIVWARHPMSIRQVKLESTDVDSLASAFSQLCIGYCNKNNRTVQLSKANPGRSGFNVTSPYTVWPLHAPLASLVQNTTSHVAHSLHPSDDNDHSTPISYGPAATLSGHEKNWSTLTLSPTKKPLEPLSSYPSPASSINLLPSLVCSLGSSSASAYSRSPTPSFATLSDDGRLLSSDSSNHEACESQLKSPPLHCLSDKFLPSLVASNIFLDFTKGLLDQVFGLDLPACPSYSESFELISQGLQSSPDFPPPSLTLPSFAT